VALLASADAVQFVVQFVAGLGDASLVKFFRLAHYREDAGFVGLLIYL